MNLVMTLKDTYIQFRIREDVKNSLQKVAEMRGLTMSALLHSLAVKAIREEKEREPQAFQPKGVKAATVHVSRQETKRKTG